MVNFNEMDGENKMNILLAYSTRHYTPGGGGEERLAASSAATLACTLYGILSRYGEVEYVDGVKPPKKLKRRQYDLLVGIQGSLTPLCRLARFDKVVLFAVNMHPAERNLILQSFNERYRVCSSKHVVRNCVHLRQMDDIERADAVLLVGNATIARSFLKHGTALESLRRFNYTSALPLRDVASLAPGKPVRVLYVATEMCLRKGFDVLSDMLLSVRELSFLCGIVGSGGDAEYRAKLAALQAELGDKLVVHGWVDSSSPEYVQLLRGYDVVLFPSLEEGQAGSVLDAMSQGLVPLITRQTGVDFSPLGFLVPEIQSAANAELLRRVLALDAEDLRALQCRTLAWYQQNHADWEQNLARALDAFIRTGSPWPHRDETMRGYICSPPGAMSASLVYDMADKLEQAPALAAVAVCRGEGHPLSRLQWRQVEEAPTDAVVLSRGQGGSPCLIGEHDEGGVDSLSAPVAARTRASRAERWLCAPMMRLLGWIHPSKQVRKRCYNAWRLLTR